MPPASVSRPNSSDGPESHPAPTLAQAGALSVALNVAVCNPTDEFTVKAIVVLWVSEPEVPVTVTLVVPAAAEAEAVNVSVEVALPLAGGVTGFVEKATVTPVGKPEVLSVVAELKLFWLVMVTVLAPFPPCVTVTDEGEAPIVKLGVAAGLTVSAMVALCVSAPETPVIVTVAVPVAAEAEAASVRVDVALPPEGGVTGLVENDALTPLGRPEALRVVAELKPFRLLTVMVLVPFEPCVTVSDDGEAAIV